MIRLKFENGKFIMENEIGRKIEFNLSQKHIGEVIRKNIDAIDKAGCGIMIEKLADNECYLILDENYKLLIPELAAYEISSRMPLLNAALKLPEDNVVESDET